MHLLVGVSHLSNVTQSLVGCRRCNIDFGWILGFDIGVQIEISVEGATAQCEFCTEPNVQGLADPC